MTTTAYPPSLPRRQPVMSAGAENSPGTGHTLMHRMDDGCYALLMRKRGYRPQSKADFIGKMKSFLVDDTRGAKKQGASADHIAPAKYAFCAAIDQIILRSPDGTRDSWERRPLQLVLFGDQLAGEHFFNCLEGRRVHDARRLQALQILQMCLPGGLQGKYIIEGLEKQARLAARLSNEIAYMMGKKTGFAPHAERPGPNIPKLRNDGPLWVLRSIFAPICTVGYIALRNMLGHFIEKSMSAYNDVVKLAPKQANLTITLP